MKYMLTWTLAPGLQRAAAKAFLEHGAPLPEGVSVIGRWHVPGSARGWLVVETDDIRAVAAHLVKWGNLLETEVTPVIDDVTAAEVMRDVLGDEV